MPGLWGMYLVIHALYITDGDPDTHTRRTETRNGRILRKQSGKYIQDNILVTSLVFIL